jgi:hypothetical protein
MRWCGPPAGARRDGRQLLDQWAAQARPSRFFNFKPREQTRGDRSPRALRAAVPSACERKTSASSRCSSEGEELAPQYERTTGYEVLKGNPVDEVHVAPSPTAYDSTFMPMKSA